MSLTKDKIANSVRTQLDLSEKRTFGLLESVLEIIEKKLESGEDVLISGFGKFCVNEKKERKGRNPATGEDLMLGARRVVTFRSSVRLREKINVKRQKI